MEDVNKVGGISEFKKIATLAQAANLPVAPHSFYFGPGLAARPTLLAFTKMDLTGARENAECAMAEVRHPPEKIHFISAATGEGIAPLLDGMLALRKRQTNVA